MNIEQTQVLNHEKLSGEYRVLVLEAPSMAPLVKPGQFVHLRVPYLNGAVLRRPFSVFKVEGKALSILYKCVGKGTHAMTDLTPGDEVSIMGPLGSGFPFDHTDTFPVIVAGGYGVAPLYLLATRMSEKGIVFVGGSSTADVLCVEDFEALSWEVRIATEDGNLGEKGLVTDVLDSWLECRSPLQPSPEFYACGPDDMLKVISERATSGGWKAWLSLDKHMGCGVGACLACVQKIRQDDGTETWARVCREGPVFEAREIVWE